MEKRNIDELFNKGLKHPEVSYDEMQWTAMEQKLDKAKGKRGRVVRLVSLLSAAAVLVLLFLIFGPAIENKKTGSELVGKQTKREDAPRSGSGAIAADEDNGNTVDSSSAIMLSERYVDKREGDIQTGIRLKEIENLIYKDSLSISVKTAGTTSVSPNRSVWKPAYVNVMKPSKVLQPSPQQPKQRAGSLTILVAPDATSVRGAGNAAFSSNIGLMYTQPLSNRISVSGGVSYARKNYTAPYSFYRPNVRLDWSERPSQVDAACDVLDVPILLNYNVYNKNVMRVHVSAGVSSYFMLRERYQFSYDSESSYDNNLLPSYEVRGKNNHLFGVADLSVSVDRKVNENMRIGIRPFIKVPLTGIGYGQTKLESKGVAVTLDFKFGGRRE